MTGKNKKVNNVSGAGREFRLSPDIVFNNRQ
nr:MAG TPA: hypothetical protein [Caudoviricetes sp.]